MTTKQRRTGRGAGRWILVAMVAAAGVLAWLGRGRPRERQAEGIRTLWTFHHYAVSPDMPEVNRQWELGSLLKAHGWRPVIFATGFNHKARRYMRPTSLRRPVIARDERGVDFVWLYSTPYDTNNWRRYVNMLAYMVVAVGEGVRRRPAPDVVIGTTPQPLAALAAWIVARRHRVPFVLEVQDLWPEAIVQLGTTSPLVVTPLEWLERFLYRHADHILSLSNGITDGIVAKEVSPATVTLISNAAMRPDPTDCAWRQAFRERMGWDSATIAIWIGAHGPANGLDTIVDAARLLDGHPHLRFVLIGDGPEKRGLIRQAAGLRNITFLDPIPKAEVEGYLRAADIGIMNSRRFAAFEGTRPCKLFDYMAAGLPIMASMPGEAGQITREAGAGIEAEWENPRSIADAILRLAEDGDLRKALGANGFSYSLSHSREDTADDLAALLDKVVAKSRNSCR